MSDFDAVIEAERQRSAATAAGGAAAGRPEDWLRTVARIELLLAATAAELANRNAVALPVVAFPPRRGPARLTRRPTAVVVDRRRPVLDLFSLDARGGPFLERGALAAEEVWLRVSHAGRAKALRAALLGAGLTPQTVILREGPPIVLDADRAAREGRAGGCFGVADDGTLVVYPPADAAPVPLVEALTAAVANAAPQV
ncbi:hypothetical protein OG948_32005 [Embleya sp. NBC_00888]|uniref:hypothetical protein n=1 Tax=Embleya sp. NBC_00888 TaxID=2975960 RepID=UPI003869EFD0|nr:hypothetical protein OG948_32005 [Embleya sp. NBC_00888]